MKNTITELQELKNSLLNGQVNQKLLDKYKAYLDGNVEVTKLSIHGSDRKKLSRRLNWMSPIKLSKMDRVTAKGEWSFMYNISRSENTTPSYHMIITKEKDKKPYILKGYDIAS